MAMIVVYAKPTVASFSRLLKTQSTNTALRVKNKIIVGFCDSVRGSEMRLSSLFGSQFQTFPARIPPSSLTAAVPIKSVEREPLLATAAKFLCSVFGQTSHIVKCPATTNAQLRLLPPLRFSPAGISDGVPIEYRPCLCHFFTLRGAIGALCGVALKCDVGVIISVRAGKVSEPPSIGKFVSVGGCIFMLVGFGIGLRSPACFFPWCRPPLL